MLSRMCVKNKDEDVNVTTEQLNLIMKAVGKIEPVNNGISILDTKLDFNTELIKREIEERKEEDVKIKSNYKSQFKDVKNKIEEVRKSQNRFLMAIIGILLGSTFFLFVVVTWEHIVKIFFP